MRWGDGRHAKTLINYHDQHWLVHCACWAMSGSNSFPSRPPCRPPELAPCSLRCSLTSSLRPSHTCCNIHIRPLAKTPPHNVRGSAAPRESCIAPVSWNDASWRRMVNEFFLREINAHRCIMSNLSRGSASAMRMLRQEACDLGEASRLVGDNGKTTRLQGHQAARLQSAFGDSKVTRHQIVRGEAGSIAVERRAGGCQASERRAW